MIIKQTNVYLKNNNKQTNVNLSKWKKLVFFAAAKKKTNLLFCVK